MLCCGQLDWPEICGACAELAPPCMPHRLPCSSTVALTVFPFFTYVPSSGLMGDSLPKVQVLG